MVGASCVGGSAHCSLTQETERLAREESHRNSTQILRHTCTMCSAIQTCHVYCTCTYACTLKSMLSGSWEDSCVERSDSDSLARRRALLRTGRMGLGVVQGEESRWRGVAMKQGGSWPRRAEN